ncbi:MAG TPA: esterase, partial [Burkholderiaceae bacterium]
AGVQRKAFAAQAYAALRTTVENDRIAAFDARDGLYGGEQSFLDWREQTYAPWVTGDLASMASSKALSTNAAHYRALLLTAQLAREARRLTDARKYTAWASTLKAAMRRRFWLSDAGLYSSMTAGHFDGAPLHRYDSLGSSLAILHGIADRAQADSMLSRYPHGPMGPPVVFPQQRDVPVYHNRAIWPFVTAYSLRAAAASGHISAADRAYDSLVRGAALNLSNMENLEWLSGQGMLMDERRPGLSGPVINSRRQLWSVGAYLGMVVRQVFGVQVADAGVAFAPFMTSHVRRTLLAGGDTASLHDLKLRGKSVHVQLLLPAVESRDGRYPVRSVRLNGKPVRGPVAWARLRDGDKIAIAFGALVPAKDAVRLVGNDPYADDPAVYGPATPALRLGANGVEIAGKPEAGVSVAPALDGARRPCYAVEALHAATGNRSHRSAPVCTATATYPLTAPLRNWGAPGDVYTGVWFMLNSGGAHAVQLGYVNLANAINLGISNGVKWLEVHDMAGRTVARGVVQMPHTQPGAAPSYSTPVQWQARPGRYRIVLSDHYNMSYLAANAQFEKGGGPRNRVDLHAVRITRP